MLPDDYELWGDKGRMVKAEPITLNTDNVIYLSKRDYTVKVSLSSGYSIYVSQKDAEKIKRALANRRS